MSGYPSISDLWVGYTFVPSDQMVLRRYRPLDYLRSYFEDGLFSNNLSEFKDVEEGRLVRGEKDGEKAASRRRPKNGPYLDPMEIPARQKLIREKYFANCMRAGTDEDPDIWKEYVDENMKEGVALEMTFGNLRRQLPPNGYHRHAGMCWYIDRSTKKRPWMEAPAICLLKGKKHKAQREFRLLSRYDSTNLTYPDEWEWPNSGNGKPDYGGEPRVWLNIDTGAITDRVILAPNADQEVRRKVENILSDNSLNIPVVKSQMRGGPRFSKAHGADVRMGSQRVNFEGEVSSSKPQGYHQGVVDQWMDDRDVDEFPVVDVVERCWWGLAILEYHKHPNSDPTIAIDDYLHDNVPYETTVHRVEGQNNIKVVKNSNAK